MTKPYGTLKDGTRLLATRKRYGPPHAVTYTWISALLGSEWVELGDPWPAVMPKLEEIEAAVASVRKRAWNVPLGGELLTTKSV